MVEGRSKHDWTLASELLAAQYNALRDPKKRKQPYTGNDFNPYAPRRKQKAHKTTSVAEWAQLARRSPKNARSS